jgi:hypothetical protein
MDNESMKYIHRRLIADATLKVGDGEEIIIAKDGVMNIAGRYFVILYAGKEAFRAPHKHVEAFMMQSGNGMVFYHTPKRGEREVVRVHFVADVKTVPWHDQNKR